LVTDHKLIFNAVVKYFFANAATTFVT